jgi:phosphoglycerate-specific signal transduction histidine kinase
MGDHHRRLREDGLRFFGATTAGQSHEITNVLNIINELAGLQSDLLTAVENGRELNIARLKALAERIQNQVNRGEAIVRNLNRFAHSVDVPVAVFDLRELLERVVFLARRPAGLRRIRLDAELPAESVALEGNPFCVQQAVYLAIDVALHGATEERRVVVSYAVRPSGAEILVTSADPVTPSEETDGRLALLERLMAEIGGSVAGRPTAVDPHRLALSLPKWPGGGVAEP